jgi:hypothetical protein
MRFKMNVLALFATTVLLATVLIATMAAQTTLESAQLVTNAPPGAGQTGMVTMRVEDMDAAPVKGAPFCASVVTEHTQAFADGNRIHSSDNSTLCRDSQGRTRREADLIMIGTAAKKSPAKLITIVDPVAGFHYTLDPNQQIARRSPMPSGPGTIRAADSNRVHIAYKVKDGASDAVIAGGEGGNVFFQKMGQTSDDHAPATENLGDQIIEGIHATGTRITTTIPAGQMGNEQPMAVTSERWYSPELKATVMTKHSDPWAGELKTAFTSVNTAEPESSLFAVPSNYKIVDEKGGPFTIHLQPPAPAQ